MRKLKTIKCKVQNLVTTNPERAAKLTAASIMCVSLLSNPVFALDPNTAMQNVIKMIFGLFAFAGICMAAYGLFMLVKSFLSDEGERNITKGISFLLAGLICMAFGVIMTQVLGEDVTSKKFI